MTIQPVVWWIVTAVVSFLLFVWTMQDAWTAGGDTVNFIQLWDYLAYTTSGPFWYFIVHILPRVIRWVTVVFVVLIVANLTLSFSVLLAIPYLILIVIACVGGTFANLVYWWNKDDISAGSKIINIIKDF